MQLSVKFDEETLIDLVVNPEGDKNYKIALVADGWLKQVNKYDVEAALNKSNKIKAAGYIVYPVWSIHWWRNPEASAEELVKFVLNYQNNQTVEN